MSTIALPTPDAETIARRDAIAEDLRKLIAAPEAVIVEEDERRPYETDALSCYRQMPLLVVLPESTEEVSAVMRYCHDNGIKIVARGAGTSLTGGALPAEDAIVVGVSRMTKVLDMDFENRTATVQPGVTNINITNAVSHEGFFYAPDPSSQLACSIGGNVAMNSGGAHCLKYGVTTNNLLGMEFVLMTGEVIRLGGKAMDAEGYDLMGLITGSEGTLGIVTEITVRILRSPEGARPILFGFDSNEAAGAAVAAIIASGIIPVAIEFMDKPAIKVCEDFAKAGYPLDVEALLIVEVEGSDDEIDFLLEKIQAIASDHDPKYIRVSGSEAETAAIWKGRKAAFGAVGQLGDYFCMDGTIPMGQLPHVLKRVAEMSEETGFQVANIFHAGDGNLHPLIIFDINSDDELVRAEQFGADVLKLCVDVGGCLTGEHGVGIEKRDLMTHQFNPIDLDQQMRLKSAFDPEWLLNPAKVFPLEGRSDGLRHAAE